MGRKVDRRTEKRTIREDEEFLAERSVNVLDDLGYGYNTGAKPCIRCSSGARDCLDCDSSHYNFS
jgi:hypothetical protein